MTMHDIRNELTISKKVSDKLSDILLPDRLKQNYVSDISICEYTYKMYKKLESKSEYKKYLTILLHMLQIVNRHFDSETKYLSFKHPTDPSKLMVAKFEKNRVGYVITPFSLKNGTLSSKKM